ncbi:MAG: hypothetical protein EBT93_17650 [Alphaproteobacteria bacterium]|nr:hypothetical protein [Alphaproteobacteria bacterium]
MACDAWPATALDQETCINQSTLPEQQPLPNAIVRSGTTPAFTNITVMCRWRTAYNTIHGQDCEGLLALFQQSPVMFGSISSNNG